MMLAEFILFRRSVALYHATAYPRWTDQIQYLIEAYTAYDHLQAHGLIAGAKFALGKNAVQGTLHDFCAMLVFWVQGSASRTGALSVNMFVFLLWQGVLFFTIHRVTRSLALAWMSFGLLLCVASPWAVEAGSAVDFRLDHGAMCLMGITACMALLTDGFRATSWSLAFGAAVGVTVLERFLAGAYFAVIFVVAGIWVLCARDRWTRFRNLLLAGFTAAVLTVPVYWLNREGIYNYYWVGHVTGTESAARLRGFDFVESIRFVAGNLGRLHLGAFLGWVVVAGTAVLFLFYAIFSSKKNAANVRGWIFWGLTFFLVPVAVLTVHQQKSEFVLGILVPGLLLLILWLWQSLWHRIAFPAVQPWQRFLPGALAFVIVLAGTGYFSVRQLPSPHSENFTESARDVAEVAEYIFHTSASAKIAAPNVGIDRIVDYIDGRILRVICYEKHKTWIPFQVHLPDSILAEADDVIFFKLAYCDFMIVTDTEEAAFGYWPYDRQMQRLAPQIKQWCNERLILIRSFKTFGRKMSLYQRLELP
ncbi:hypothetical protein [Oleiharenicola lentus]|uniref:hypothetical protein n=1 Tax=Oleiharenicola lentus TaxID=2508720 RepID=UPI003F679E7A